MYLRTALLPEKKFIGKSIQMSLAEDRTQELWQLFMKERKTIRQIPGTDLCNLVVYDPPLDLQNFQPTTVFTKYALAEVANFDELPESMESFVLSSGLYAVFLHRGHPASFPQTLGYIFGQWLPSSGYTLDHRPHFELLGEKYKNNAPDSEEEVWIPIRENDYAKAHVKVRSE